MCLALPYKVIAQEKGEIRLDFLGKQQKVKSSLIKVQPGDFVLVQKDTIIKKVPKKQAQEILKLISKK
ncbi:HypC/HybG/HupF family hydrogenase formation chaperone [bacterium]|nr:HypC/HybG/HupF family hydrogenase formation chaperone [bacterium]